MSLPDSVVVDTNVGIVANLNATFRPSAPWHASAHCERSPTGGHLTLDANGLICAEYRRYLSMAGQPGTGDAFVRWVHDNQYNPDLCTRIPLTPTEDENFAEFPATDDLVKFDRADRKFVSVSAAHPDSPPIQVALDRGWVQHADALAAAGVAVHFLCPADASERT